MARPRTSTKRRKTKWNGPTRGAFARYLANQIDSDGEKVLKESGNTKGLGAVKIKQEE